MIACRIRFFPLALAILLLASCAHNGTPEVQNATQEVWDFELTGDTRGNCKMLLARTKVQNDLFRIAGSFSGMTYDYVGGPGELDCKFNGKLKNRNLDCEFTGWGDMEEVVFLNGRFTGTLNDEEGSGEWQVTHTRGSSAGTWKMKRRSL
ncbi:MAG: hypothetical protein CVU57_11230 [Deltaproteobacteria bacterium HGW-Deltaproteobacteria-15]|nr:MAG: hypothetical protein CVU57_11230 [Deltaproteobacteria bacterium HGW-Deltaproteobacteria-15]